ncbi:MAG: urea ABC transporter ATP-binding protein UrtD [Pseudomonadota bacterium]|nr:urea ABC transporter ATP-binding protein UrtD [Pseudomonadota bacterium]
MTQSDFLLAVEDLTVRFGGFCALDHVNLYVDQGEVRVIIGPNGAGKTTLLDLICGKTAASGGSVRFDNQELLRLREHSIVRLGVARKFQTPSIYEELTVFQNLEVSYPRGRTAFGSLFFRRTAAIAAEIRALADELALAAQLDVPAGELSHGQKQWLEIGMLLIQDPKLLLLDEPVAGMSAAEREQTVGLLRRISGQRSIVVIEHDMEFVEAIAHRVTVMHQGKILKEGSMAAVKADPRVIEAYLGH